MRVSLKQLKIIEAIAQAHSFSRAAKLLHMTQPAISMQVKQLEASIELALFERQGKLMVLTEAGVELLHCAQQVHEQIRQTEQIMAAMRGIQHGRLHLTMAATANYFAPQLIAAFHRQYPQVDIQLSATNRQGLLGALDAHSADMVIMGAPPEGHQLLGKPFMANPLVVIAHPSHPFAYRQHIPLQELGDSRFIVRESGSGTRRAAEFFFAEHGLHLHAGVEMNRVEAIKQAVMAELGLGIVSAHTLEMELKLKRLVVLNIEAFPIVRHWYIVHKEGKRFTPVAQAFCQFVLDHAESLIHLPKL
ncbi:MAG: LysR family transcriptional regulator [Mariprofundaceae bacterium]|nr:LysR family transcriptional regulator [Mariprofundaceae bacterium]